MSGAREEGHHVGDDRREKGDLLRELIDDFHRAEEVGSTSDSMKDMVKRQFYRFSRKLMKWVPLVDADDVPVKRKRKRRRTK